MRVQENSTSPMHRLAHRAALATMVPAIVGCSATVLVGLLTGYARPLAVRAAGERGSAPARHVRDGSSTTDHVEPRGPGRSEPAR